MTLFQISELAVIVNGAWITMSAMMQKKPTVGRVVVVLLCFAAVVGAFALGSYWNHDNFACKTGQHCFPWGD